MSIPLIETFQGLAVARGIARTVVYLAPSWAVLACQDPRVITDARWTIELLEQAVRALREVLPPEVSP